jgi:chorismate mutase
MRCSETSSDLDVRFSFDKTHHTPSLLRVHGNSAVWSLTHVYGHKAVENRPDIYRKHRDN